VGVVIPAFNAARTLPNAVQSVLEQNLPDDRVIVVDDGSTDETPAVLEKYRGRLEYVRQRNCGPSAARNAGWTRLDTDVVIFLDADDFLLPGALAIRRSLVERGAAWAYTEGWLKEPNGARCSFSAAYPIEGDQREGNIFPALLCRNFITTSSAIVRRDLLEHTGGFDENLCGTEDWDLWLRLAICHPAVYTAEPTFVQCRWPGTLSSNREAMVRMRYHMLVKILRLFPKEVKAAGWLARRSVADAHNAFGYALASEGRWAEARRFLRTSIQLYPQQRRVWWLLLRTIGAFH